MYANSEFPLENIWGGFPTYPASSYTHANYEYKHQLCNLITSVFTYSF